MRFGSRNQQDDDSRRAPPSSVTEQRAPERTEQRPPDRAERAPEPPPEPPRQQRQSPPPSSTAMTAARMDPGSVTSSRLRRIAEYFGAQADLLSEMRRQTEIETTPLAELLVRQAQTMREMLINLDERLRPLNEYADGEEANLAALEQRMHAQGMDFIARSFADYVQMQRDRIEATRQQIGEQRAPFLRYEEDQRNAIESALSRFDDDLRALETNLEEQRKVVMRMLEGMRSEGFLAVKELLGNRESLMIDLVRTGITDPAEVGSRLHALRNELSVDPSNPHLRTVLAVTDVADQRLMTATGMTGRRAATQQLSEGAGAASGGSLGSAQDQQPSASGGGAAGGQGEQAGGARGPASAGAQPQQPSAGASERYGGVQASERD